VRSRSWPVATPRSCRTTGGDPGATLQQAYERALLLEWLAKVYRLSLSYGEPRILSADELAEVEAEVRRRRYGGPSLEDGAR